MSPATAFWRGFVAPTPFALGLMVVSFVLTAWIASVVPTPERIAGSWGQYLPRSEKDNEAFATREALTLSLPSAPGDTAPQLTILGSSISAHAFASEPGMADAIRAATGKDWHVSILTTPLQGTVDEAALADHATRRRSGVVVLSIGFMRFGAPAKEYVDLGRMERLGIRSDWADAQMRMLGGEPRRQTGNYAVDNRNFLLRNADVLLLRWLGGNPARRRIDAYWQPRASHETQHREMLEYLERSAKPDPVGVKLLDDIVRRIEARGSSVVLFEEPVNPALLDDQTHSALYENHIVRSAKVAASVGAFYCRPAQPLRPTTADYGDFDHIAVPAAQARQRQALAACVAALPGKGGKS